MGQYPVMLEVLKNFEVIHPDMNVPFLPAGHFFDLVSFQGSLVTTLCANFDVM
jgi:hypothetical protein